MRLGWRRTERTPSLLEQVARLTVENRVRRDAATEERLVRLLHQAFAELDAAPLAGWPLAFDDPFPETRGRPPEISPAELNPAILGGAIQHHGCLLVRGLFSPERVATLVEDTECAFRARTDAEAGAPASETTPWYVPFEPGAEWPSLKDAQRKWVRDCGAIWIADSPAAMFDVMEGLREAGIPELLRDYLGEPPAMSVNKCTLRRVHPAASGAWHQDGSFLGSGMRTVDVWVALSECGGDTSAPGLAIVPRRIDHVLATHLEGAVSSIAVGADALDEVLRGEPPLRPDFAAGDALLFDELFLHCTGGTTDKTSDRYALEAWFFAPSAFPSMYVPMAV
jgi:hypothetical protein